MKKGYSSIVNARNLEIVFFGGALGYLLALVVNKRACPPCAPCAAANAPIGLAFTTRPVAPNASQVPR